VKYESFFSRLPGTCKRRVGVDTKYADVKLITFVILKLSALYFPVTFLSGHTWSSHVIVADCLVKVSLVKKQWRSRCIWKHTICLLLGDWYRRGFRKWTALRRSTDRYANQLLKIKMHKMKQEGLNFLRRSLRHAILM